MIDEDKLKGLASGAIAGIIADVFTHPLSTVKTRLQCQGAATKGSLTGEQYKGFFSGFRHIVKTEGVSSLYRGIGIVVAAAAPGQALYFTGYEGIRALGDKSPTANFAAGVCAQLCGSLAWVPMDVIKERLQIEGQLKTNEAYSGSFNALKQIIKTEGIIGLYRAFWIHQMTWAPFNGIYFSVYEYSKLKYRNYSDQTGILFNLPCTAVAGTVASALTSPIDLVKTRLQVQQSNPLVFDYKGPIDAAIKIVKREGFIALFDGLPARVIWLTPRLSLAVSIYEQLKSYL